MAIGNSNTSPPGLMHPTTSSYTQGTGNPRDSAIAANNNMNAKQSSLASIGGRKKRRKTYRKYKGGNTSTPAPPVAVTQIQMPYTPTGGPGSNPNDQIAGLSSTSMQSAAWNVNDNQSSKMGGSKRRQNGGVKWGCHSGGTKRKRKRKRKRTTRKHLEQRVF